VKAQERRGFFLETTGFKRASGRWEDLEEDFGGLSPYSGFAQKVRKTSPLGSRRYATANKDVHSAITDIASEGTVRILKIKRLLSGIAHLCWRLRIGDCGFQIEEGTQPLAFLCKAPYSPL